MTTMRLAAAAFAALTGLTTAMLLAPAAHPVRAQAGDVQAVLAQPRQRLQAADYRATGHLVRVDASGVRKSYPITLKAHWFPGILRVLCEINASGADRVRILLEMRPDGQNAIRIAHPGDKVAASLPLDKWSDGPLGSGFSYEDFLEPQYFWPGQTVQPNIKYGARNCDLLKSTPGPPDRTRYAEVSTWLDHGIGYPVYVEKTLKTSGIVKEFTYFGLRQTDGVWWASQVEEKRHGMAGSTLLIIERGSTRANLNLGDFSPEQLAHF